MNKNCGKLIVIEGLDGTGKATQTKILLARLKKEKYEPVVFDFPQYHRFFGKLVATYLRGEFGQAHQVNPYFASMLYALDRWSISQKIKKSLEEGRIVLANRYSTANFLHQTGKIKNKFERIKFLKWLENLEFVFLGIPKPNLVIFLDLLPYFGKKLIKKKNQRNYLKGKKQDIHEKSISHLKDARNESKHLIKKYYWRKIICFKGKKILTRQDIANKIWLNLEKYKIIKV
ncbi:MAG: thymidylate kinase [Bacteroidetes bacterium]|nr:thymidylate kinase [Bacteroidota bacterium]